MTKYHIYTNKKIGNNTEKFNITKAREEDPTTIISEQSISNSCGKTTSITTRDISQKEIGEIFTNYAKTGQLKLPLDADSITVTNYDPENGQQTRIIVPIKD